MRGHLGDGHRPDGQPRSTYLYHLVDNETTMREYGNQAVVWQTAINPAVALELLDRGEWKGAGVLGPEAFPPAPFLELLGEYGAPHGQVEVPRELSLSGSVSDIRGRHSDAGCSASRSHQRQLEQYVYQRHASASW